jgi:hypothetical protein
MELALKCCCSITAVSYILSALERKRFLGFFQLSRDSSIACRVSVTAVLLRVKNEFQVEAVQKSPLCPLEHDCGDATLIQNECNYYQ